MDKEAVVARYNQLVKELGEEPCDVVLSAGAALVMMGVRDQTADLDADVNEGVFKMHGRAKGILTDGLNPRVAFDDTVDLHARDESAGVVCVEGVWIYSPSSMLLQKRHLMHDPKRKPEKFVQDGLDIALLEQLVQQQKLTARVVA